MPVEIVESVGSEGANRSEDVEAVQQALSDLAELTKDFRLDPGHVSGSGGDGTEGAIEHLQRLMGTQNPDARIDPDGRTLRRLNAWLDIADTEITYPFAEKSAFAFSGPKAGPRAFGTRRSKGKRVHAGIDLYFPDFTPVLAMADGVVTRAPYPFYYETFAVEVDHGSFIARYGEMAPETTPFVEEGDRVERGQTLGRVGILVKNGNRLDIASMMLHLECYDKTEEGALTRRDGPSALDATGKSYQRRRDLINPTPFVARAELPG